MINLLPTRITLYVTIAIGFIAELLALYFQYGLDYGPCVLCIHIRVAIFGILAVAIIGLLLQTKPKALATCFALMVLLNTWLLERTLNVLGVEQGWIHSTCGMDAGFPSWIALDTWFPAIFEPWEPCGYTPYMVAKITMAEILVAMAATGFIVSLLLFIRTAKAIRQKNTKLDS